MSVRYLNASGTQALINEIKARLAYKTDSMITQQLQAKILQVEESIPTHISQLENDSEYLTSAQASENYYPKTSGENLANIVQDNVTALARLNADATVEGSVDYKIQQAIGEASNIESITNEEIDALF